MTTQEIRGIIRERTGIDVAPEYGIDPKELLLARLECEKTNKNFAYDMADELRAVIHGSNSQRKLTIERVLQADPWELAEAMAMAIQEEGRE